MTFSATRNPDAKAAPKSAPPEPIVRPAVKLAAFDPWAGGIDPARLTEEGRAALPEHERAPEGWFTLDPDTRARLGGLAIALLAEAPPDVLAERFAGPWQRRAEVRRLFDAALKGTYTTRARLEANHQTPAAVGHAARFYVEDERDRALWQRDHRALQSLPIARQTALVKDLVARLDDSRGVVATLRAGRKRLDDILEALEQRLTGGKR